MYTDICRRFFNNLSTPYEPPKDLMITHTTHTTQVGWHWPLTSVLAHHLQEFIILFVTPFYGPVCQTKSVVLLLTTCWLRPHTLRPPLLYCQHLCIRSRWNICMKPTSLSFVCELSVYIMGVYWKIWYHYKIYEIRTTPIWKHSVLSTSWQRFEFAT